MTEESQKSLRHLRVANVAQLLDCSKKRVYQLVNEGKLDAISLGVRGIRIPQVALEKFIEQRKR